MRTQTVVLECAGHRRNEYRPRTVGLQWGVGAVSEARWTGISVAEMLAEASPTDAACEVVFEGADRGQHRSSSKEVPFARSIPLERALAGDVLLSWKMNGRPIPPRHGAPIRAIVPGSYGVASVKWLTRIEFVDKEYLGYWEWQGWSNSSERQLQSVVDDPFNGAKISGENFVITGWAIANEVGVRKVEISTALSPSVPTTVGNS